MWTHLRSALLLACACGGVAEAPPEPGVAPATSEAGSVVEPAPPERSPSQRSGACAEPAPDRAPLHQLTEPGELLVNGGLEDADALPVATGSPGERSRAAARSGRWGWSLPAGQRLSLPFVPDKSSDVRASVWVRAVSGSGRARLALGGPDRADGLDPKAAKAASEGKVAKAGKAAKAPRPGGASAGDWVDIGEQWVELSLRDSLTRTTPQAVLSVETSTDLYVDDLSFTVPVLKLPEGARLVGGVPVPEKPAAPFHFAFLLHVEDEAGLSEGGPRWEDNMGAIEGLARALHAHGGALTVQPELDWVQGAAAWRARNGGRDRIEALIRDEDLKLSTHTHGPVCVDASGRPRGAGACKQNPSWAPANADGDVLSYVRERREALGAVAGAPITDHNGNFELSSFAGLAGLGVQTLSAYKDRWEQSGLPALRTNPWRPAGSGASLSAFLAHDPAGPLIYLPGSGVALSRDLRRLSDRLRRVLGQTLRFADPERVNTAYVVLPVSTFVHGGPAARAEGGGSLEADLRYLEQALTEVVDPLVAAGYLRWSSLPEMGAAYQRWERACGSTAALDPAALAPASPVAPAAAALTEPAALRRPTAEDPCPGGCVNFVVNVHDFTHPTESADTVLRLVDIFSSAGVKGEFYLTWPVVAAWRDSRPDVIARLRDSGMTISYHSRPPNPLVPGFDGALDGLRGAALEARIRELEIHDQDLRTGASLPDRVGGYQGVAELLGAAPATVSILQDDPQVKAAAYRVYAALGARAAVWYHEEGTRSDRPLELRDGLLVRPSDLSVTRWASDGGGNPQFWWNRVARDPAYDPLSYLKRRLASWTGARGPIITAIIHENDLSRSGDAGFTAIYFAGGDKSAPLAPPWRLDLPDRTRPRPEAEKQAIWAAYEAMVRWSASELRVVTAADLAPLAATTPEEGAAPGQK